MGYEIAGEAVDAEAVRAAAKAADSARNAATRAANGTAAKKRRGKHVALSAGAKAARAAQRASDRKCRSSQREAAQAEREVALSDERDRRKVLRLILRGQQQDDIDAARRPRRMPILVKADKEPRVTADGGKRLYRRFELLTSGATSSSASRVASDGLHSIVVRVTARGFGGSGKTRWRRNEGANLVRYFTRADALERVPCMCILSNLVDDDGKDVTGRVLEPGTDEWAREHFALWQAIEKLEADAAKTKPGKPPAKTNVYRHVIIPLPHELDADERLELVREITDVFRARGLPFAAAIHRPDPGGDQRNFHVHIIVSARPSIPVGVYEWQFEALKDRDVFTPEYLLAFRIHVAEQFNQALAKAGSDRVYTHVSRNDRNVEAVAEPHEGRSKTNAQRRADHVVEVTRQLDVKREERAQLAALAHLGRELARVVRSSGDLAGYVWAEACESVRMARQLLANPTDLSIDTAQVILHSTVNTVADAAAPLFEVTEEAPVRRLPVATPTPEVAIEMEVKAVERPTTAALPAATTVAASFEPTTKPILAGRLAITPQPLVAPAAQMSTDGPSVAPSAAVTQPSAQMTVHSTDNNVTQSATSPIELAEEAPVRRLPVAKSPSETTLKMYYKAIGSPATPLAPVVSTFAPSFDLAPPASPRTALEIALVIAREPELAEIKDPSAAFARALDDGKIRFEQAADGVLKLSVSDIESGRALWKITESAIGYDYLQRVMREVPAATADTGRGGFAVFVQKGRTTFPDPHLNALLPVLYKGWRELEPRLRYHAMVIIDAAAAHRIGAELGTNVRDFFVRAPEGSATLESAVAMRRSVDGRRLLYSLAQVSPAQPVGLTRGWKEVEHPRLERTAPVPVPEQAAERTVQPTSSGLDAEQVRTAKTYAASVKAPAEDACYRVVAGLALDELALRIDPDGRTICGWVRNASLRDDLNTLAAIPARYVQLLELAGMEVASGPGPARGWLRWQSDRVGKTGTAEHAAELSPPRGPDRDWSR